MSNSNFRQRILIFILINITWLSRNLLQVRVNGLVLKLVYFVRGKMKRMIQDMPILIGLEYSRPNKVSSLDAIKFMCLYI